MGSRISLYLSIFALLQLAATVPVFAEEAAPKEAVEASKGEGAGGTAANGWYWRRSTLPDYLGVVLAIGGTVYFEHKNGEPEKAHWTARNGFDEGIRDALRLEKRSARDVAHTASDVIMGMMIGAPVIEPLATLGMRDGRWDDLWQTEMVNLESFTFTSLVSSLMQNLIARERPFGRYCVAGRCEDTQVNRSMPSGHAAFSFTGAGLVCTHHEYQGFYDSPEANRAMCATGLGLAAVDGVLRIMADRHYTTDVLAGTALGLFSGFLLPRLLHYSWPQQPKERAEGSQKSIRLSAVTPLIYTSGGGLNCEFRF